jgi:hypothetical protein
MDNGKQLRSQSYLLPVEDKGFLLHDEMRAIRFGLEHAKAELVLRDHGIRSTVVVFGSARIRSRPEARRRITGARHNGGKRAPDLSRWHEIAHRFARPVSERGGALAGEGRIRDNVIATGGGPGIMEAANRGAADAGAPSIGFNITLPQEQQPNAWSSPDLTFRFPYLAMRKMHLAMRANALAIFPGGFGTLDEMLEILTPLQTGQMPAIPVVLFGRDDWQRIISFKDLLEAGMVEEKDLARFEIVDEAGEPGNRSRRAG